MLPVGINKKESHLVIDAEVRLGELLINMDDFHSSGRGTMKRKELPTTINKKESHYAQEIYRNKDLVNTQPKFHQENHGIYPYGLYFLTHYYIYFTRVMYI